MVDSDFGGNLSRNACLQCVAFDALWHWCTVGLGSGDLVVETLLALAKNVKYGIA